MLDSDSVYEIGQCRYWKYQIVTCYGGYMYVGISCREWIQAEVLGIVEYRGCEQGGIVWWDMGIKQGEIYELKLDYEVENDLLYPKFGYKNTPKNVKYPGVLIH